MHADHEGSNTLITDINGNVVENTWYSPFGEIIEGGKNSRFDYTGKEKDEKTGEYDFNARMYKAEWGRFLKPETIFPNAYNPQLLNHYSYVNNNPFKYVDPTGNLLEAVYDADNDDLVIYEIHVDGTKSRVGVVIGVDYGNDLIDSGKQYYYQPIGSTGPDFVILTEDGEIRKLNELIKESASKSDSVENQEFTQEVASCIACHYGGFGGTGQKIAFGVGIGTTSIDVYNSKSNFDVVYQSLGAVPLACYLPCITNYVNPSYNGLVAYQDITFYNSNTNTINTASQRFSSGGSGFRSTRTIIFYNSKGEITGGSFGSIGMSPGFAKKFASVFGKSLSK